MKIVFFGAPGVGKGTFAELLSKREKIKHINIGSILRNEIKNDSSLGKEIKKIVVSGNLVSDNLILNIVEKEIKNAFDKYRGFILDGFPRNIIQSKDLIKITNIDLFVNIYLPRNILIKKLLGRRLCSKCDNNFNIADIQENDFNMPKILPSNECNICKGKANLIKRSDDNEEIINHRLNSYESIHLPIINFFKNCNYNIIDFELKRGIKDFDNLYNIIMKYF